MYLIYQDEKGIKVAREDGRLDEYTKYYSTEEEAKFVLAPPNFKPLPFEVVENDVSML